MATFTTEEVELLRNRGNDYCRRVWLGLYEGKPPTHSGDEQVVRDFLVEKYERRRYYLDPSTNAVVNGKMNHTVPDQQSVPANKPLSQLISEPKPLRVNGNVLPPPQRSRPEVQSKPLQNGITTDFVADFDKADIFTNNNNINGAHNNSSNGSFANFDNNPVFNTNNMTHNGMPMPTTLHNWNNQQQKQQPLTNMATKGAPPPEDRYAALKDLDNQYKSQTTLDWNSSGSNGSLYSSPTPTGSVYSSPSPQGSMFGSPSQSQFMTAFPPQENGTVNPFTSNGFSWTTPVNNVNHLQQQPFANPFREQLKVNGYSQSFQTVPSGFAIATPLPVNGTTAWAPNPFKVGGATTMNSNNPFL